jgi:FixJ family two-component response regulator
MISPPVTVCVVDDEEAVRKALVRLLKAAGFDARGFASPGEYLEQHDPQTPGCLVLDVAMPGCTGLDLQDALAAAGRERSIVFLTGQGDIPMSVKAMKAGAIDFLTKPIDDKQLLNAVHAAIERDRNARQDRAELETIRERLDTLTHREREVFEHVVTGKMNKQIAADLGTVEKTIKVHRGRVMAKMQVDSVAELVRVASLAGIKTGSGPVSG